MKNKDTINYDEEGIMHGRQKIFNGDDRMIFDVNYNHGKAHGLWIDMFDNKTNRSYYDDNILEGEGIDYEC